MTHRVLVVEDNEELAENLAELLGELDVSVECVVGVQEALEVASGGFEVALVDVSLPEGSGVALVPELKGRSQDAEVILMTGHGTLETAIGALRHGAYAYVLKPFEPVQLIQLVQRALAQVALGRERTALSRALHESEALYRGVVEAAEALIVGIDDDGRITFANRSAQLGYGATTTGKLFVELWGERVRSSLERALRGAPVRPRESTVTTPAGTRTIRWTLTRVPEAERRIAVVAVGIDVTEQVELRRRSARAEALAAVGTLTAGLAHEIRNPLNAAALQLQLLERGARKLEPSAAEAIVARVGIVRDELGRLTKMLDEFLGLARPEELDAETMDVRGLLDEVLALEEPVCARASVRLLVEAEEGVCVRADRHRLKQVLVNLVTNAREALPEGGTIRMGCEAGDGVVIYVQDDGPGFSHAADKIFEPFHSTKAAGTGLGMSIVKKIVDMHGGTIELGEAPGGGARVTMVFPNG